MKRLVLLVLLLAYPPYLQASAPEAKLDRLVLYLDWIPNVEFAGMFFGIDKGWYKQAGIDLQFIHHDLNIVDRVVSGEADIGMESSPRLISAIASGSPVRTFAVQYQLNPNSILVRDRRDIQHPKDLRGKKLGIFAPQDIDMFRVMLGYHGIQIDKRNLVPMNSFKELDIIEALKTNKVDAIIAWEFNWSVSFALLGFQSRIFPGYDNGFHFYGVSFFARKEFIDRNLDLLTRFMEVTLRGWKAVYKDPDRIADLVVENYYPKDRYLNGSKELTQQQQRVELKLRRRYFQEGVGEDYWGYMTDEKWRMGLDLARRYGLIPKHSELRPQDLYDRRVLQALYPNRKDR